MWKVLVLSLLALPNSIGEDPVKDKYIHDDAKYIYTTHHNFDVYSYVPDPPTQQELQYATWITVSAFADYFNLNDRDVTRIWNRPINIYIRPLLYDHKFEYCKADSPIRCSGFWCGSISDSNYCWGRYSSARNRIDYVHRPCLADTSFAHEVLHLLEDIVAHPHLRGHSDITLFDTMCKLMKTKELKQSCLDANAEYQANQAIRHAICR